MRELSETAALRGRERSEYRSTAVVEIKLMVVVVQPLLHRPPLKQADVQVDADAAEPVIMENADQKLVEKQAASKTACPAGGRCSAAPVVEGLDPPSMWS